jgi:hypothetical protein
VSYTYTVIAHSPAGDSAASPASSGVSAAEPEIPSAAPTNAPTTLTTTDGVLSSVKPSQHFTVVGTGFAPYSTVSIIIYSSPVVLGAVVVGSNGDFSKPVTIPANLSAGDHNVVASGVDPSGTIHFLRMPVTLAASAAVTTTTASPLASTGVPIGELSVWAMALIGCGAAAAVGGRRRLRPGDHG